MKSIISFQHTWCMHLSQPLLCYSAGCMACLLLLTLPLLLLLLLLLRWATKLGGPDAWNREFTA
jgi:hypothetical protein